jgi:cytochrome P450
MRLDATVVTKTGVSTDIPVIDADPYSDDILRSPYALHAQLRDSGPVVYLPKYGVYAMARYEDVRAALKDHDSFVSGRGVGLIDLKYKSTWRRPSLLIEADPPAHTAVRQVMSAVISPGTVRALRPQFREAAVTLIEQLVNHGSFDGITQLAETFPLQVMADAIGISGEGCADLLAYSEHSFNSFGPRNERFTSAVDRIATIHQWVMDLCRREALAEGGLGMKVWDAADRNQLTDDQALMLVRSLLSAGFDTTAFAIGNALHALATTPSQWAELHAHPELARFAFDEALRFESVVQTFARVTKQEVEVDGTIVPRDSKVLLFLGAANRDPRHWGASADQFDIHRKAQGHVGFGMGIHQCVGQPLARLEAEAILSELVARVERVSVVGEILPKLNNTLKGWASLPLSIG